MNVIYARISNERAPRFRLLTRITENEDGSRSVIKSPCCALAEPHVRMLKESCSRMKELYRDSALNIVPCEIHGHDAVFPFIEGNTLEKMLLDLFRDKDRDGFLELFRRFFRLITAGISLVDFRMCAEYRAVFRDAALPEGVQAMPFSNIDMIPSNIIVDSRGTWNVLDYEWVFDFPIPVEYILYRAVMVFQFQHDLRGLFPGQELYTLLGIDPERLSVFQKMDQCFAEYVTEGSDRARPYASLLKEMQTIDSLCEYKEKHAVLQAQNDELKRENIEYKEKHAFLQAQNDELKWGWIESSEQIEKLQGALHQLNNQYSELHQQYLIKCTDFDVINGAFFWRITGPLRRMSDRLKYSLRDNSAAHWIWREMKRIKNGGSLPAPTPAPSEQPACEVVAAPPAESAVMAGGDLICCDAYTPPSNLKELLNDTPIDVILPIYNGRTILPPALESIPRTTLPYRLILVDDKSTDEEILPMLRAYSAERENVLLIENEVNLGYTLSINKALRKCHGHVVLLNSDIRLPNYWLERLLMPMLMDEKVCSATPFTNSGTICSFPRFCQDNEIYLGMSVDEIDAVFGRLRPRYTTIPTGVGFCMALSKRALEQVGLYDEVSFPRGYGEENDWCQRAIQAGFRNVMVENLFVYHQHGATFTSDEKRALMEKNTRILLEKFPDYSSDVQKYIQADPVSGYRLTAQMLFFRESSAPILAFNHNWGGGATFYLDNKEKELRAEGRELIQIRYVAGKGYALFRKNGEEEVSICASSLQQLFPLLPDRLHAIWINELVTFPELATAMISILRLAKTHKATIRFLVHDYYCICPHYILMDSDGRFCGVCRVGIDQPCCDKYVGIEAWRRKWSLFLSFCDEIIVFSEDSKRLLKRAYPQLTNILVVPHEVPVLRKVCPKPRTDTLTIGVIGAINNEKGLKIIEEMAALIRAGKLPVHITIIGYTAYIPEDMETITITGKYERDNLPDMLEQCNVDIVFIPSICSETFSFTTSEAIYMDLPLACFNLGAPAERVANYDKGIIIPEVSAQSALDTIYGYWESL